MAWIKALFGVIAAFNGSLIPSNVVRFSQMYAAGGVSVNCTETYVSKSGTGWGNVGTSEAYDFTDYTTLTISGEITSYQGNDLVLGYGPSRYSGFDLYNHMTTHQDLNGNRTFTVTFDISSRTGYYFVLIGGGNMNYRIDSAVLS